MPKKITLLNVFCGDGESAVGYSAAGFAVTGLDTKRSRYMPSRFDVIVDADPLASVLLGLYDSYDVVAISSLPRNVDPTELSAELRKRPFNWVIESTPRRDMRDAVTLTGWAFGSPLERRRLYLSDLSLFAAPSPSRSRSANRNPVDLAAALGIDWSLPPSRLKSATPTMYSQFLGRQLLPLAKAVRGV